MAYKTGRSRTISASGSISGVVNYEHDESVPAVPNGSASDMSFSISAFGAVFTGHSEVPGPDPGVYEPGLGSNAIWAITAATPSAGASNQVAMTYGDGNPGGDPVPGQVWTADIDPSGTWSMSGTAVEWVDFGLSDGDESDGIFDVPPKAHLTFYETWANGEPITATITSGGITAMASGIPSDDSPVDYSTTLGVSGFCVNESQSFSVSGGNAPATSYSRSADGCSASNGAAVSVSASNMNAPNGAGGYFDGIGNRASMSTTSYPPRAFNITGGLKTPGGSYLGTASISLSRFSGDSSPASARSDGWSDSYAQKRGTYSASVVTECTGASSDDGAAAFSDTDNPGVYEWQSVTPIVDSTWCLANDEYVTYENEGGATGCKYDDINYMHGWPSYGISLTQAASLSVDNCDSIENWTGAATGGGGLQNTDATMTRNWPETTDTPPKPYGFDFSGYRYLRLHNVSASEAATVTLSLGGKTWVIPVSVTAADIDVDLCGPDTGGSDIDLTDTKWPLTAENLNTSTGPLWGVSYSESLSLAIPQGVMLTIQGLSQISKAETTGNFLSGFAPRAGIDTPMEVPPVSFGTDGDGVSIAYAHRGLVCDTDGRQSLEYRDLYVESIEPPSGADSWNVKYWPLSEMVSYINAGDGNILPSGGCGWTASTDAPASDSSSNLYGGFLNQDTVASASWACYGLYYDPSSGWSSGLGQLSAAGRVLFTEIDWYPGCGDIFGFAPEGTENPNGAIYLVASKIFRAQTRGILISDQSQPAVLQNVTLTPAPGELQDDSTPVGWGRSGRPDGYYRTGGPGLIGYTTTGTAPDLSTSGSQGVVAALGQIATQTYHTARISRVAIRGPITQDCCDQLFFQDPTLSDPLPELPGDEDAMPVEEWKRAS